ncbi:reverse transcriptase family protein [Caproiciproducens sp. R2]|uniref:reverse transcriptase family protein n=1 Tax=Caproiciproducens sp. R2 TaxID=3435187 RepID=UPI0040333996
MLHTLEDFCRYLYHNRDGRKFYRCYYQLLRLSREKYRCGCYTLRELPKGESGTRLLCVPNRALRRVQKGILGLLPAAGPRCATAYLPGKSVLDNARPHLGQPLVVKLDIHAFFDSISFAQVFRAVDRALEVSPCVGCHYLNADDRSFLENRNYNGVLSFYFARFCTLGGSLPQGAPTSPLLSNLVFGPIDGQISAYCGRRGIAYTRYSDDMTFSGSFNPLALIDFVRRVLAENGFTLNDRKTRILNRGQRRKITGVVANQKLQAPREYRREIRRELYYIRKYGWESHLAHENIAQGPEEYRRSLLGRVGFVLQLCPADGEFLRYRQWLLEN